MNFMPQNESKPQYVDLTPLHGPRYLVTVDTEEEFDWNRPFSRDQHGTRHIPAITPFQSLCEESGVKPLYLIDYPVACDPYATELLGGFVHLGQAEIGMQLHPWVTPPFNETVGNRNSFACNLPPKLEQEKLHILYEKIAHNFQLQPNIYRAGRYGIGTITPQMLQELGINFDTSVRSNYDYSSDGGPCFIDAPLNPFWLKQGNLIELPLTTVFHGGLRRHATLIYFGSAAWKMPRALLARTGLLERIALTPEGVPLHKAIIAINNALAQKIGLLNLSFHSPSLEPGHTNYVRNTDELAAFYAWWRGVFAHLEKCGVRPVNMGEMKAKLIGALV